MKVRLPLLMCQPAELMGKIVDPATYFDDEEDDGIKGQNIVYPDAEDYADVIRVDTNKISYNTFYEPRDTS